MTGWQPNIENEQELCKSIGRLFSQKQPTAATGVLKWLAVSSFPGPLQPSSSCPFWPSGLPQLSGSNAIAAYSLLHQGCPQLVHQTSSGSHETLALAAVLAA